MKISIVVPTCPAHGDDTFSPKANAMFHYPQEYDDDARETFSTQYSSESAVGGLYDESVLYDTHQFGSSRNSDEEYAYQFEYPQENKYVGPSRDSYSQASGFVPRSEPLSSSNMYNALVVGPTPKHYNTGSAKEDDKTTISISSTLPATYSVSTTAPLSGSIVNQAMSHETEASSRDEVYQRLVVGSSPAAVAQVVQAKPSLQNPSFQSVESNSSTQHLVFQSPSYNNRSNVKFWNPRFALPAQIAEDDEEDEDDDEARQNELLSMMGDREMYRAMVMAPLVMAAARKAAGRSKTPKHDKNAVKGITCAAETIENDMFAMIDTLWCGMLGPPEEAAGHELDDDDDDDDAEKEENEEDVPITRLSADLRKQRLRNEVLSHERDTVTKENEELRKQLQEKESEIAAMKIKMQELEDTKKKAEDETIERDMRTAMMMNEFLENQLELA